MKILLTGGAGYVGSHTAVVLAQNGCDIIVADNFSNSSPEVIRRIEEISGKHICLYTLNIGERKELEKVFDENEIEAVIHFAGSKAVAESVADPLKYYRNNVGSTLVLLETMKKYKVREIIFSSSATVYGKPEKCPVTEKDRVGECSNPYGRTKIMIEQIIRDTAAADPDMSAVLLRYFNPIGAHKSGRIGELPQGIPDNLMPYITQVAIGQRKELNIYGGDYPTRDGTGVRDYIHVMDLARGHMAALNYCRGNKGTEVFNLGTGIGYSVLEIVEAFKRVNNVDIPYRIVERRAGDIAESYADASLAAEKMGWKPELGLEDMCHDSWNWQKNNPNGYES